MVFSQLALRPQLRRVIALISLACVARWLPQWLRSYLSASSRRQQSNDASVRRGSRASNDAPRGGQRRVPPRQQHYNGQVQDGNTTGRHGNNIVPHRVDRSASDQGTPKLWTAVESGDADVVQRLLQNGCRVDETCSGWTPLMKASEDGRAEILTMLLDHRANIEAVNSKGRTALSFAAAPSMGRKSCITTLQLVLEARANLDHRDSRGETPQARALRDGHEQSVRAIDVFKASIANSSGRLIAD